MRFNPRTILAALVCLLAGCAAQSPTGPALTAVTAMVSAGGGHTCVLSARGKMECWGANNSGQIGIGESSVSQIFTLPTMITGFGDVDQTADSTLIIDQVATGMWHTCVRTRSQAAQCWGWNAEGQLGDGTTTSRPTSATVSGLSSGVEAISAGGAHTCAIVGGSIECWGYNAFGQLGNGATVSQTSPVAVTGITGATMIASGRNHTCAVVGGAAKCWGSNQYGQLGNGTITNSSTPVAVTGLTSGVTAVSTGGDHSCALLSSGAVECWGRNQVGQLGNGTSTFEQTTPVAVSGISTAIVLAAGYWHSCALLAAGTVQCWGYDLHGELGSGLSSNTSTPLTVSGVTGASGLSAGWWHTCALLASGSLQCWGRNESGQLGNGTTTSCKNAANVVGF